MEREVQAIAIKNTVLIFSKLRSSRLEYIANLTGMLCMGQPFRVTQDPEEYQAASFPKINYSDEIFQEGEIRIIPHGLLFESGISDQRIECAELKATTVFFQRGGDLGFDIFAASFYLVSRYEEYLPHNHDEYGRYGHFNSLAAKNGFLDQPLVNKWICLLRERMSLPDPNQFCFIPTYDIDEAWSYKNKGWARSLGGMIRDGLKGDWGKVSLREKVRAGKQADPYDSFGWMDELHVKYNLKPIYFLLLAEENGQYDKNILPSAPSMRLLVQRLAAHYEIGIHPSWQSGDDPSLIKKEIDQLEQIMGKPVKISRQHFLRFKLPEGYRRLTEAGIKEDHSMGYGTINGFRASIASSFYWYDLEREKQTDLLIHPFCFMDANSFYELKQSPSQALEELMYLEKQVRSVNGQLITLWHNTFLGTENRFNGWKEIYEEFISH